MEETTGSSSSRCYKQWLWLMVLIVSFSVSDVDAVWPMPQMISSSMDRYTLNPRDFVFHYSAGSSAQAGCSLLDSAFKRYFPLIFTGYRAGPRRHDEWFRFPFTVVVHVERAECESYPDADSSESYKLSVCSGQAALTAETVWGALRGLESFSQLVYQDDFGEYFVNKTEIEDFPRFQFRGLLLDTSRHYLPLHAILKTLDAMSYNKFNVFHWHIVDDPSFPYQSSTFPDLSSKGAFHPSTHVYTQIDVKRVIAHARLRGIRVLAEFDSPGHTQSWGKGQPGLLTPCYKGTVPSGTFGPVDPANSSNYQFMTRLFKEVTSVFPDSYIHLGGDEVDFTCWKSNPDVRGFMLKMGFGTDYTKLESYYMENMVNITKGLNKTAIVWQDVFDYHEKIPVDTVLHIWKGSPAQIQQELSSITLAGYRVILAAPWYINHISYGQDWTKYYTIQPLNFTGTEQQKKLVIGGEVCMWGEYVDATNLSPRLWPRASAAAERLWSDEKMTSSVTDAFPRLVDFRCRLLREKIGYYNSVNIIKPEDAAILFKAEGHYPKRLTVEAWTSYRDYRNRKYGVLLKNGEDWRSNRVILNREVISPKVLGNFVPLLDEVGQDFVARVHKKIEMSGQDKWTTDLSQELFKYALESVGSVLYGERLGLMLDYINPEAQHFIDCISLMFKTTSPMLYIPPAMLRRVGAKIWRDHVEAWDGIFNQADRCIQNIYRTMRQDTPGKYPGVLASLLMLDKLSIEDIKASVTELMAGGVDTTSITLLWTLYELARHPDLQEELRAEVAAARQSTQGDVLQMLKMIPLVKGALKETLRLHPVAVSLQRYITEEIIIQNYHIPCGTLVQLGLYAMGRDPDVFPRPEKYLPSRWLRTENQYFRSLGFGFGPRQCLGRRIAETEMQLFLIHMLENFRVDKQRQVEVHSTFELILLPDKPILLTLKPLKSSQ